jgi:hypothetical protein
VPHDTIASLRHQPVPSESRWIGEPGAIDLWLVLMAGKTAIVDTSVRVAAA